MGRTRKVVNAPKRYGYGDIIAYALNIDMTFSHEELKSFKEAMSSKDCAKWSLAMKEEMKSLYKNETYKLVKKSTEAKLIGNKWIYKIKVVNSESEQLMYKALLVAKGNTEKDERDFNEMFSPVVKYNLIRIILATVTRFDMHFEQMYVQITFVHGTLEK